MTVSSLFDSSRLVSEQRDVVDADPEASFVVVGAPGTGKTATVVARVAALVAQGVSVDSIVVLTATRSAATGLRDELGLAAGAATSGPLARSVASFAYGLVRSAEVAAGRESPQLLTGGDEDQIIRDLLDGDAEDEAESTSRWPVELSADVRATTGFRSEVRAFIAECTTLGIDPRSLTSWAEKRDIPAWGAMATFMSEYLGVRARMRGAYRDAATLIREAIPLARSGAAPHLKAVIVDDAQELTRGGVELVEALFHRGVPVTAFGDPDVGSGAFRGATPENFARLAASLGSMRVLRSHHRGTACQIDLVSRVTQHIGAVGVVDHRRAPTHVPPDGTVRSRLARSAGEELDMIARALRERHVHDNVPWSECAVIAHDGRQIAQLEAELVAREVPAHASGPGTALGALRPVRDLLRVVALAVDETAWEVSVVEDALQGAGMDPIELRRLRSALRHTELANGGGRPARELLMSAMRNPIEFVLLDTREGRRAARVAETIALLAEQRLGGASAHELLWTAWERSGNERTWHEATRGTGPLAAAANRDLDAVVSLFQAAKRFGERLPDAEALDFVRSVSESDVAEDRLETSLSRDAVRILTPAAAASTEFDTVIVAGVQEGVWPNTRLRGSALDTWRLAAVHDGADAGADTVDRRRSAMHDELRLFVRAISRVRRRLMVTAVDDDDNGPSVIFELLPPPEPIGVGSEHPLTLRGLVAAHRRTLTEPRSANGARLAAAEQLALLADAGVAGAHPDSWYTGLFPTSTEPLRDISREDIRVSPSLMHTIEECQLNWVIGDLGGDPGGAVAGLGTIIHAALETADSISEESMLRVVDARWGELEFESPWRDRAERARAQDLVRRLHVYLRRFEAEGGRLIDAEPHFEVPLALAGFETDPGDEEHHHVILSGYIDRVEQRPDGAVEIVDLKTGKSEPQTDNKVTDNAQLAAYQLAFAAGAIPGTAGLPSGGAKLLVLRPTAASRDFVTPHQPPLSEEERALFITRVHAAASVMRGVSFTAPYEQHCRDEHSFGLCRIHTISAVSAS
ncbi:superfamily I DNA/RNA helicase/RecB family exonuclease [Microbacterium halimionae]|uniref:DNA 3'-5' helicase n=1 Tax=Microbacterium halimionae TaxID=1526413 RepID=A0A7W3JQY8_9MICO|nr:ATP-dependent DNA helicase [Microbacterium halimionae]MBA8817328.1 superfamily I DNA/RNA helicase/RecB family exonuclease [Microbacterium halimionae]NII95962.1 superfamily I DNA/RNA helicase/RecB family exonuclease [Microbacterium halimionae]